VREDENPVGAGDGDSTKKKGGGWYICTPFNPKVLTHADLSRNDNHELEWRDVPNFVALIITLTLVETICRRFCLKGTRRYAGLCGAPYVRAEDIPGIASTRSLGGEQTRPYFY